MDRKNRRGGRSRVPGVTVCACRVGLARPSSRRRAIVGGVYPVAAMSQLFGTGVLDAWAATISNQNG
jgi:hypothetical protein